MNLFIYSDESGVFDKVHNDVFVFGGVLFLSKEDQDVASRKYKSVEKIIRAGKYSEQTELKACRISNREKGKIFRSLNPYDKFGVIIREDKVLDQVFLNKKDKQRYLDYAYKVGLKRFFQHLIAKNKFHPADVEGLYVFADEHTTATSGCYELQESLEQEFKLGTFNTNWSQYFPPLFPNTRVVKVVFCNSETKTLIRAADIVANRIFHCAFKGGDVLRELREKVFLVELP